MTAVTMWIVGDFESILGRKLLLNALKHVVSIPDDVNDVIVVAYCLFKPGRLVIGLSEFKFLDRLTERL